LKKIGWKVLIESKDSAIYSVAPLAEAEYERMYQTLDSKPVYRALATHWARLIELRYAAERLLEPCRDPKNADPNIRIISRATTVDGVGIPEAPRGTLIHHYQTGERGMTNKVNLIVSTGNNNAAIYMSIKKVTQALIQKGKEATEGILDMVEMAYRAYDPCFVCATHALPVRCP